jgi:hypothetical protein
MVSLIEAMKKSWVEKFGVGLDPSMGWPNEWANKYIEKLEEHMRANAPVPQGRVPNQEDNDAEHWYFEAVDRMLKFLRGKEP